MANWSTTTKHEPSSINNGRRYELRDRVSIEQLNNMTENSFYAMEASSVAKEKAEEALKFAQGSGTTVFENGEPVAQFNADKKVDVAELENYYTKGQVDALIESGGSADVDLSNYYTKQETYSKQEVDDKLANLDVDIDFSDYYTKNETNSLLSEKADKSEIPDISGKADKSEIPDVSSFITKSVNDLINYYKKSETYTQAEVNALVSAIPKFKVEVVTELPYDNANESTIYLLKTSDTETRNLYTEYIYTGRAFEKLGTQTLDLSNYYTKDQVNSITDGLDTRKADKSEIPYVADFIKKDVDNLTNYYKKSETYTKTETENLLDAGLSTKANKSELESYVTKTGLESTLVSKGYLTQDALNGYATESYVSTNFNNLDYSLRQLIGTKADASSLSSLQEEVGRVSSNLSTVRNKYLKSAFVSDDGNSLQIYDQDNKVTLFTSGGYDDSEIRGLINEKVDKVSGKGLSTNDYTTAEKNKLAGLSNYTAGNGISIENGIISSEHPIGSYHICKTGSEDPAIKFGGKWKQIATNVVFPLGNLAPVGAIGTETALSSVFSGTGISWTGQVASGRDVLVRVSEKNTYIYTDLAKSSNAISGVDVWWRYE